MKYGYQISCPFVGLLIIALFCLLMLNGNELSCNETPRFSDGVYILRKSLRQKGQETQLKTKTKRDRKRSNPRARLSCELSILKWSRARAQKKNRKRKYVARLSPAVSREGKRSLIE